jgi:flavin-dependent dehydrogenase
VDTYCPRRTILDKLLVDAAAQSGAELFEGVAVDEVEWSDGRATGVTARHRSGARLRLTGRWIVGADGLHSTIGSKVGAETYALHPPLTCVYYAYWSGVRPRGASFHPRPGRLVLVWPTNDELTCVYVAWRRAEFPRFKADVEANFLATLELVPGLRERITAGRRETPFRGTADLPNQYRRSHGPGWALVGDAGHHKDPSTGMGMSDAFVSAELLAVALDDCAAGRRPQAEALAEYGRARDAATAFARVLRFDPTHAGALYFEGSLLAGQHRYREAIERWHRVIDLEPAGEYARRARRDARTAADLQYIFSAREPDGAGAAEAH